METGASARELNVTAPTSTSGWSRLTVVTMSSTDNRAAPCAGGLDLNSLSDQAFN